MIPKREYIQAIKNLQQAMTQLAPDGKVCAICEDTDHQAFECHFNPLVVAEKADGFQNSWRCFQCNEIFTTEDKAAEAMKYSRLKIRRQSILVNDNRLGHFLCAVVGRLSKP
jgi:uncharacterized protein with PIN domain